MKNARMFSAFKAFKTRQADIHPQDDSGGVAVIDSPIVVMPQPLPGAPRASLKGISYEEFQAMRSYLDIAEATGFRPAELVLTEMYDFMEKNEIKIFDYDEVLKWLDSKKPKGIKHWCWRPLRSQDIITPFRWGFKKDSDDIAVSGYYRSGMWECRPYARLVPRHALEKVEKIHLKFGDEVKIFVSDFAVPDLDPFIMARPALCDDGGGKRDYKVIFDAWDEPGFGS